MKFQAKSIMSVDELDYKEIPHNDGFVIGCLLGDIIVGNYIEIEESCIIFEWWVRIDKKTIKIIEEEK